MPNESDCEPFRLSNPPERRRAKFDSDKARQNVLFSGLSCLSGQENLFPTDGRIEDAKVATASERTS